MPDRPPLPAQASNSHAQLPLRERQADVARLPQRVVAAGQLVGVVRRVEVELQVLAAAITALAGTHQAQLALQPQAMVVAHADDAPAVVVRRVGRIR